VYKVLVDYANSSIRIYIQPNCDFTMSLYKLQPCIETKGETWKKITLLPSSMSCGLHNMENNCFFEEHDNEEDRNLETI